MSPKSMIWIGVLVGSTLGGLLPMLWGADMMSMSSIVFSTIGALVGIWAGYKASQMI